MKMITRLSLFGLLFIVGCGDKSPSKKVLVMGRGELTSTENNVTMSSGTGHVETTVDLKEEQAATLNVKTPDGSKAVNVPADKGYYILNLKTDTLVGSRQNLGQDLSGRTMTQEELRLKIDSLAQLVVGTNVNEKNGNYFILPGEIKKISNELNAQVYGPFTRIPGAIETDADGKLPEIFKFYTNTEMRELIEKLRKQTY